MSVPSTATELLVMYRFGTDALASELANQLALIPGMPASRTLHSLPKRRTTRR